MNNSNVNNISHDESERANSSVVDEEAEDLFINKKQLQRKRTVN